MAAKNFKETKMYRLAFEQAMDIYDITKRFPKEETYSLTDQVRRSSRSVCANLGEAYRKKRYPAHFVLKAADSDAENTETNIWLDFSLACNYISLSEHIKCIRRNDEIGRLLFHLINNSEKY